MERFSHSILSLTFTVGTSLTTGVPNSCTWASIHHKTSLSRGAHGYPDPNYFRNCNVELDMLGVPSARELDNDGECIPFGQYAPAGSGAALDRAIVETGTTEQCRDGKASSSFQQSISANKTSGPCPSTMVSDDFNQGPQNPPHNNTGPSVRVRGSDTVRQREEAKITIGSTGKPPSWFCFLSLRSRSLAHPTNLFYLFVAPAVHNHSSSSHQVSVSDKEKKEKEKFLMFTRVLMKYLEQRDQDMHTRAKAQIKECYEKNKQGDPNFKSLTTSMKARLKQTVGDAYWKKAHDYLDHFLKQKKAGQARQHAGEKHHERSFPFFVSLLPSDVLQLRLLGPNWTLAKTRRTSVKTRLVYIELLAAVWASSLSACTAFSSRDLTLTFSF